MTGFFAIGKVDPSTFANYRDYNIRIQVNKAYGRMTDTSCYAAVEKQAVTDESLDRAGSLNRLCLLKSMPDVTRMSDRGTLLKTTTQEKEGVVLTLVLRPGLSDHTSGGLTAKKITWSCGVSPAEAIKFAPEECQHLVGPQKEFEVAEPAQALTLNQAVSWNDLDEARRLVAAGADVNQVMRTDGDTPLITALRRGHHEMVSFLLAHGAQVSQTGRAGYADIFNRKTAGEIHPLFSYAQV